MNVLDLFSGIGGFSLGLERAGMRTVAFCEIEPYCRAVLAKRWPGIPIHEDIRALSLRRGFADVICGGFPCQDISLAGDGAGLAGSRSGLWSEYRRLIDEVRPTWTIIENVSALRSRGLDQVLRELTAIGYDAEWHCIPACAVGAPHIRDRIWIVAYPERERIRLESRRGGGPSGPRTPLLAIDGALRALADTYVAGQQSREKFDGGSLPREQGALGDDADRCRRAAWWEIEPDVGRVADGVPSRVDRLRALGNAVIPQIPEIIGREIVRCSQVG